MQYTVLKVADNGSEEIPYNSAGYPVFAGDGWLHSFWQMGATDHWHWDMEFSYVLEGQMSYNINRDTVTLSAGEGIFINSGQIHRNYSLDGTDGKYRCVLIHPSMLHTAFGAAEQLLHSLNSNTRPAFTILRPGIAWQAALIGDINTLFRLVNGGVEQHIFSILSRSFGIAQTLADNLPSASGEVSAPRDTDALRGMLGYIQLHYREKLTIADISRAGMVSTSTCHALFRKFFGTSPMKYVTGYRLEKAAGLLKNTVLPVADVADMTGFSGASYFTECFRMLYGTTPTAFRQQKTDP